MSAWHFKLFALLVGVIFVGFIVFKDWNRNKIFLAYFLLLLFSQTGFAYAIRPGYHTSAAELLYFGILFVLFLKLLRNRASVPDVGVKLPVRFYLAVSFLGILTAVYHNIMPLNILIEFKAYAFYVFYIYVVAFLLDTKNDIRRVMWAYAIVGILPLFTVLPNLQSLAYLTETGRSAAMAATREWGTLNIYIGYELPLIFVLITLISIADTKLKKGVLLIYVGVCVYTIFYAQTRTAWGALIISLVLYAVLVRAKLKFVLLGMVMLFVLIVAGKYQAIENIIQKRLVDQTIEEQDSSLQKRFERWELATATLKKYPLLGSGWGGHYYLRPDGSLSSSSWPSLPRWHNSFFEIMSQLGLLGLIAFYWIWVRIGKYVLKTNRLITDKQDRLILSGLIAATSAIFIYSLGEQQFFKIETASVSWFTIGLMLTFARFINLQYQDSISSNN